MYDKNNVAGNVMFIKDSIVLEQNSKLIWFIFKITSMKTRILYKINLYHYSYFLSLLILGKDVVFALFQYFARQLRLEFRDFSTWAVVSR